MPEPLDEPVSKASRDHARSYPRVGASRPAARPAIHQREDSQPYQPSVDARAAICFLGDAYSRAMILWVSEPGSAAPDYRADNPTLLRCQSLLLEETFDPDTRQMTY